MSATRLLVDISSHGFGHFAQTTPILNHLQRLLPALELVVRCGLPTEQLRTRLQGKWQHIRATRDFGFVMLDASRIDHHQTLSQYTAFHEQWPSLVEQDTRFLKELAPDLVLTNVAYLPLVAAAQAGIPSLSMCSLNWADLFAHFYGHEEQGRKIHAQILAAYNQAKYFMRLTPAMPMDNLTNTLVMPPVASAGNHIQAVLRHKVGIPDHCRMVLVAFGGFDKRIDVRQWPTINNVHWIVPTSWNTKRHDMSTLESCGFLFADLVASVDAVLTKPGYGTFTEAACNGTPVIYVPRDDWPEQICLIEWLHVHGRGIALDESDLQTGNLKDALLAIWENSERPAAVPEGSHQVAEFIARQLDMIRV